MPDNRESAAWAHQITNHTYVHENVKKFIDGFHHDAHPMGILVSTLAALSTFYPEAKAVHDRACQDEQVVRLIAKMPTLAAFAYRHAQGFPYNYPDDDLSYAGNFLNMMRKMTELKYDPDPVLEHALDVLFILHADHEQNCSASAMRGVASSGSDPYSAAAAAAAALYGPLHGGANEQVLKMLREIGSVASVPDYIARVKTGEQRLTGFGHRVYRNYDPRATLIKEVADQVFEVTGRNRCWTSRWSSSGSRSPTTTSSATSCTRTWTSTRASSTRPWASRWRCSRCCSRSDACPAGSPSGRRVRPIRSRRSPGPGRFTSGRACATSTGRVPDRDPAGSAA